MKYLLKYKEIEVGSIEGTDQDFLNLWGSFAQNKDIEDPALLTFLDLSIRESELIDQEHLINISSDLDKLAIEMEPFMYFIESEEWKLVTEKDEVLDILVPSFKPDKSIVWRWRI